MRKNISYQANYLSLVMYIQVPGRLYPISLEYHPIPCIEDSDRLNPAPYVRILQVKFWSIATYQLWHVQIFLSYCSFNIKYSQLLFAVTGTYKIYKKKCYWVINIFLFFFYFGRGGRYYNSVNVMYFQKIIRVKANYILS